MQPVRSVVIVGGGTAGWLTAGIIAARLQSRMKTGGFSVTLIESPDIRIIDARRARGHGRNRARRLPKNRELLAKILDYGLQSV